jgi:hypothetical protein
MKYQRIVAGAAIGTALAGIGFLLFHPSGKKLRRKAADLGLDAADKLIEFMRTHKPDFQGGTSQSNVQSKESAVAGNM